VTEADFDVEFAYFDFIHLFKFIISTWKKYIFDVDREEGERWRRKIHMNGTGVALETVSQQRSKGNV
jgi:hypothetical protein